MCIKSSTQKDLQECRQLKPKGKLLQTNGAGADYHPYLKESLSTLQRFGSSDPETEQSARVSRRLLKAVRAFQDVSRLLARTLPRLLVVVVIPRHTRKIGV